MARKSKKHEPKELKLPARKMKEETRHGILGVLALVAMVFFILAFFEKAGPAGVLTYSFLSRILGGGFLILPVLCLLLALSFFRLSDPSVASWRTVSSVFIFASSLGLLYLAAGESAGGMVGGFIARPLVNLFEQYVAFAILSAVLLIAIFLMFETHLTLDWRLFGKVLRRGDDEDSSEEDVNNITPLTVLGGDKNVAETNGSKEQEERPIKINDGSGGAQDLGAFSRLVGFKGKANAEGFIPPPLDLLEGDSGKPGVGDIKANANIIKRTLANFGIIVEMDEISIGPSITRYALKPAEGVKLARIVGLQNDLSLALAAHPIRIEAPIPGKSLVGIEIPNTSKIKVGMASLIGAKEFAESHHPLLISLGRAIAGTAHFANFAKAPHLLVAGATGSGKSVTIHAIITSLLYRNAPDKLRFIMVDPKRVELTVYNNIPHLLTPVITDAKKAIMSLKWAAKEMDRRYDILEKEAVRDIESYHKNVVEPAYEKGGDEADLPDRMPYIVIVIDELADIMTTYPREMEAGIVRLAQMSRAVGIHLLLSTQRPSVEIITGLIKANIPSRIALQVASQIDSRTILDMAGAEKLLGSGDMLYLSGDMSKPIRLQSAFISEREVKHVVSWLRDHYRDEIPQDISVGADTGTGTSAGAWSDSEMDSGNDELYEEAREIIMEAGKASASYLQRRLKVGYARAARLLDMLEERGVIGPADGAKPREVYGRQGGEVGTEVL